MVGEFGRVDFVVNNAAAPRGRDRVAVLEMPLDAWDTVMRINLRGVFLMSQAFGRELVKQGEGCSIVSQHLVDPGRAWPPEQLGLRSEQSGGAFVHRGDGAGAQGAAGAGEFHLPGPRDTARMDDLHGEPWQGMIDRNPPGRASEGDDIAFMAVYLCSNRGAWITGQAINVDGGMAGGRAV